MAHNPLKEKKKIISSVAIVVAIIAALGTGVWLRSAKNHKTAEQEKHTTTVTQVQPVDTTSAETKQVQDLLIAGKPDEASAYVAQELAKSDVGDQQKYELYASQGDIAFDQKNYDAAIASYQKAEAVTPGYRVTLSAARAAQKAGKKDVAVAYYKKAIERMDKKSPLYEDDKASLEQSIKYLGGSL